MSIPVLHYHFTFQKLAGVCTVLVIAGLGIYLVGFGRALTPTASTEVESGSVSGAATIQAGNGASNGHYLQFGSKGPIYGVLAAKTSHLATDSQAGLRFAVVEVGWDNWEPTNGANNQAYIDQIKSQVSAYRTAGWDVAVSIGLQYPPGWVLQLPNGQLVDQTGKQSGTPNYIFNQAVRTEATNYIKSIVAALAGSGVTYYRVGLSDAGEMLLGPGQNANNWWAFDDLAQGKTSGLPSGVSTSPLPGWIPGTATYNSATITQTQVRNWYDWYLAALNNAETWQVSAYRQAGYDGKLELVMPGTGAVPTVYDNRLAHNLAATSDDPYYTMNTGAVYQLALGTLPLSNIVINISSVQTDAGDSSANTCQPGDAAMSLAAADPWVSHWSSVRWLSYLAAQHGLSVMGENPGSNTATDMQAVFSLVSSCKLIALQWAFDDQLYDGVHASIGDYAAQIHAAQ